jgi:hypothetical protein
MEMRLLVLIISLLVLMQAKARAWEITALGGFNYASPTQHQGSNDYSWTGNSALDYGVSLSIPIFTPRFEIESGLFYLNSEVETNISNVDTTIDMHAVSIPLLFRFNFDPWVSVGVGGYYSMFKGNVEVSQPGNNYRQSYDAYGLSTSDAGLLFSLKAKLHITNDISFVFDGRYQHGLKNVALGSDLYNTRSIQALAGFSFED